MNGLLHAAQRLQSFCDRQSWRSCFIGGLAVQRWGEPRITRDLDLSLLTGFGGEAPYIDTLLAAYSGRISDAHRFAEQYRVLLLTTPGGIGIDVSLAALPFEESVISRASNFEFAPGLKIRTCSAEDLIVMKLFALRALDVQDATAVAIRQRNLDWPYIEEQLTPLAEIKANPEILQQLAKLRRLP